MELRIVPNLPGLGPDPPATSAGLISITEMLLQPLLLTTAMGEKGPFASWSAMATELGIVPPELVQIWDISTAWITKKSVGLDCTPLLLTMSRAYLWGNDRLAAGMVTMSSLLLTN